MPDGTGLPPGSGTSAQGAPIFAQKCAACHGENGKGGHRGAARRRAAARDPRRRQDHRQLLAVLRRRCSTSSAARCRYTRRGSLTDQEVYALTAYILALNKLIGENDAMNAQTLPKVKMPNRDNFIIRFPERI